MPNNNTGGGSGATTALLAILVVAIVAFGVWYVMAHQTPAQNTGPGGGLEVNVGGTSGNQNPQPQNSQTP